MDDRSPRRRSTTKKLVASLAILAGVASFVSAGVFSAFSDTKTNTSSLTSSAFSISQLPSSGLLPINLLGLIPGDFLDRCVTITNASDIPANVTVDPTVTGVLAPVLNVSVTEIASNVDNDGTCTNAGATSGAGAVVDALGNALPVTPPSLGEFAHNDTKYYRIRVKLRDDLINAANTATYEDKAATLTVKFVAAQAHLGGNLG